jgi:hypothetical protein
MQSRISSGLGSSANGREGRIGRSGNRESCWLLRFIVAMPARRASAAVGSSIPLQPNYEWDIRDQGDNAVDSSVFISCPPPPLGGRASLPVLIESCAAVAVSLSMSAIVPASFPVPLRQKGIRGLMPGLRSLPPQTHLPDTPARNVREARCVRHWNSR